eukprot:scaffold72598_cov40-Phaeocystis_antarctica.AAC.5
MFRLCSSQKHGCQPKERLPLVPIRDGPCLFCRRLVLAVCGDLKGQDTIVSGPIVSRRVRMKDRTSRQTAACARSSMRLIE